MLKAIQGESDQSKSLSQSKNDLILKELCMYVVTCKLVSGCLSGPNKFLMVDDVGKSDVGKSDDGK